MDPTEEAERLYPERPIKLPEGQAVVVPIPEREAFIAGAAWQAAQSTDTIASLCRELDEARAEVERLTHLNDQGGVDQGLVPTLADYSFVCRTLHEQTQVARAAERLADRYKALAEGERERIARLCDEYDTGGFGARRNMVTAQTVSTDLAAAIRALPSPSLPESQLAEAQADVERLTREQELLQAHADSQGSTWREIYEDTVELLRAAARERDEARLVNYKVLEPFARHADAVSLSDALGHIERAHLIAARDLVYQLLWKT